MERYCTGKDETFKHEKTLMVSPYGKHCTCSYVCPICNGGRVLIPCHCEKKGGKKWNRSQSGLEKQPQS